jgi:hypothetical protein
MTKRYEVLSCSNNLARLENLSDENEKKAPKAMTVRLDLIPEGSRLEHKWFALIGTPLEIEIFEKSTLPGRAQF